MVYFINYIKLVSINNLLFKIGMVAHIYNLRQENPKF